MPFRGIVESSALLDRGGKPSVRELLSSLVFNPVDGTIRLNGDRLIMQRAAVGAELRRELVRSLGAAEARVFLLRLGFLCGQADARFVRTGWPGLDIGDAFTAGTRLHMFTGVVRVETVHNDFDFRRKRFSGEFLWHDSVEGSEFRRGTKAADSPVCWTQVGYASGYASEFFDTLIVYKETECCAQGHRACRVIGKPAEMWPAGDPEVMLFRERIAANAAAVAWTNAPGPAVPRVLPTEATLSDFDRAVLAPLRPSLDRLAGLAVPVLLWGQAGSGRSRAAQYLHRVSVRPERDIRRIKGADVGTEALAAMAAPAVRGSRTASVGTVVIDGLENVPEGVLRSLAVALEEGMLSGGPRVIALSELSPGDLAARTSDEVLFAFAPGMVACPPIDAPGSDVAAVARALLPILSARLGQPTRELAPDAAELIAGCGWPGNIPELRAVLGAALIGSPGDDRMLSAAAIDAARAALARPAKDTSPKSLSDWIDAALDGGGLSLEALGDDICARAVAKSGGNLSAAARLLGLTRAQLAYRQRQSRPPPPKASPGSDQSP